MRTTDLIALALSALAQQKLRTALTTLGIVFGTVMLVASLALRRGVEKTITHEHSRFNELRQIDVRPGVPAAEATAPLEVRGSMSAERRERLQEELLRRQPREQFPAKEVRLTPERLRALAELPHVVSVRPLAIQRGRAILGDRVEYVVTIGSAPDDRLRNRLVAGSLFEGPTSRDALVSEYLLYQLGVEDEAAATAAVGKALRLEYRTGGKAAPNTLLNLLHGGSGPVAASEEKLLGKLVERLPQAVTRLDFSPEEQKAILKVLKRRPPQPSPVPEGLVEETLTIRGVLRAADREDVRRGGWFYRNADVVLPQQTAEELISRLPNAQLYGWDPVTVEVDHVDNVKEVTEQIRASGLQTHSAIEMIERDQFVYLLVFGAMTAMALIALIVSALGITNTMLMSVLERVREIGVMKAIGARDRHILAIYLVEGALVGLVGGGVGLLLCWAASFPTDAWLRGMVARRLQVRLESSIFAFPWWLLLGAPLFAALVTTLAALLPARRAVRVDPITALRHE